MAVFYWTQHAALMDFGALNVRTALEPVVRLFQLYGAGTVPLSDLHGFLRWARGSRGSPMTSVRKRVGALCAAHALGGRDAVYALTQISSNLRRMPKASDP